VYYDLVKKREEMGANDVAILRAEQLYPFPHKAFAAELKKYPNATALTYPDASFDRAIFAFNGLMCLPSRAHRLAALRSIHRVLKPDGILLFTASDREKGANAAYWAKEGQTDEDIPGDRWHESDTSPVFIHSSTEKETRDELSETGFTVLECPLSTEIAVDGPLVREFAGETRFFVARKS
jgi:SAM-dependent methyltransferase